MTNISLAQSYIIKARKRLKILPVLLEEEDYSDVFREAQEIVELALKAMLRQVGIDPPKWHDVGSVLVENESLFPPGIKEHLETLARISKWLAYRLQSFALTLQPIAFSLINSNVWITL
ncbi:MAG: HEPN domain-containing protein [Nitrospirae bacterium]|nr:MAG: HEPN domain-containing protein [Nitrospirota bacterium]